MKKIFLAFVFLCSLNAAAQDKSIKTTTFTVNGNCGDCKERIENAADIKGVKVLNWDSKTKVARVTYDESKIRIEDIQKAIAKAGYDAGTFKGDAKAYNRLPGCCKYRDGKCEEND